LNGYRMRRLRRRLTKVAKKTAGTGMSVIVAAGGAANRHEGAARLHQIFADGFRRWRFHHRHLRRKWLMIPEYC
jgi:hypothetical protein